MKLSVLIVSYNVCDLLERCLRSLELIPEDWEVIVVDNDSKDESQALLEELKVRNANFKVILLSNNVGFSQGNIEAYKHARGESILLLNPDTKVLPDAIEKMVEYLDANPEVWVVGPKLLNEDGSVQRSVRGFPTLGSQILVLLKLHNYVINRFKILQDYFLPNFDYSKTQDVDQVMGAALMTRRSIIEKIGFLDAGFKRWFEEVDFCYRTKHNGGKIVYLSEPRIVHSKGESFGTEITFKRMLKKQYYFNQGMARFFWKNKPVWQNVALFPFFIVSLVETLVLQTLLWLGVPFAKDNDW